MARDKRKIPQLIQDIGKPGSLTVEQDKQALKERINKATNDELIYLYNHSNYQSYIRPLLKSIGLEDDKIAFLDKAYSANHAIKETKEGNPDALKDKRKIPQLIQDIGKPGSLTVEQDKQALKERIGKATNDELAYLYNHSNYQSYIKPLLKSLGVEDDKIAFLDKAYSTNHAVGNGSTKSRENGTKQAMDSEEADDDGAQILQDEALNEVDNEVSNEVTDKTLLNKLFSSWKAGKLDMYPSMKALTDTIAKKAKMGQDRANILTGKGSDTSVYDPITTEMDKGRDFMREETSSFDAKAMNAKKWSEMSQTEKEDWMKMANQNGMDMETLITQIQNLGGNIEKNTQYIENLYKQQQDETTKGTIEISQMNQQMKATATANLAALQQRKVELEQLKANLAGNDWDAYAKALNAYVGTSKGLQSVGAVSTTQSQDGSSFSDKLSIEVKTGKIPAAFVSGGVSNSSTWANSSNSSDTNTGSLSTDALAYSRFPNGEKYAMASMEEKNAANEELRKSIDNQIAIIDKCIESWGKDLGL